MFINQITLKNIASYDNDGAILHTDKDINLIYGLNGTGKTTISRYLSDYNKTTYPNCSMGTNNIAGKIIVFNQDFIQRNFHEDNIPGIFTLAEQNIEAEQAIEKAHAQILINNSELGIIDKQQQEAKANQTNLYTKIKDKLWTITAEHPKTSAIGNICLDGYYASKEKLAQDLFKIPVPDSTRTIEDLIKIADKLSDDTATELTPFQRFDSDNLYKVENHELFPTIIVGNENSSIKSLIEKLNNGYWVSLGLKYLENSDNHCPFCQQEISESIVNTIHDYFDITYKENIGNITKLKSIYQESINLFESYASGFINNPFIKEMESEFNQLCQEIKKIFNSNIQKIEQKTKEPNITFYLNSSQVTLQSLNDFINNINKKINEYNAAIRNRKHAKAQLKTDFWLYLRLHYNADITEYNKSIELIQEQITLLAEKVQVLENNNKQQNVIITDNQAKTINIDKTIMTINDNLKWLGLSGFELSKHQGYENKYKLIRNTQDTTFTTLSEGEKIIITFLYFIELSKGKLSIETISEPLVVVIDDPISSLSHNYVFHVAQLIKNNFFCQLLQQNSYISQIFILTHNLYFFNELLNPLTKNDSYKNKYKLFRVIKYKCSKIIELSKDEIQNDYQAYWQVIKDCKSGQNNPILMANSMRNILEYFFGFIYKQKIKYLIELDNTHEAFKRYMDRESHSGIGTLSDVKDIDTNLFLETFKSVFITSGYEEHYNLMIGNIDNHEE